MLVSASTSPVLYTRGLEAFRAMKSGVHGSVATVNENMQWCPEVTWNVFSRHTHTRRSGDIQFIQ